MAKEIYEDYVTRNKTAVLMESLQNDNSLSILLGCLKPDQEIRCKFSLISILPLNNGAYYLAIPSTLLPSDSRWPFSFELNASI
jgi:hypothetical protein